MEANRAAGRTVALAESCTGGLVAAALTEIPGSSDVFGAGFVTYSNEAKMRLLKVNSDVLETFGAVSIAVAWSMAQGALANSDADVAVAITGIAGPGGGSEKKPVGTVVFARADGAATPRTSMPIASSSATWGAVESAFRRRWSRWNCCYRKGRGRGLRTRRSSS